jgi:LmbE family N-acetylglucosaminyl deacetylase
MSKKKKDKKQRKDEPVAPAVVAVVAPAAPVAPERPPIQGPGRAMVIMAHPDDAEFVCGGTIAKWCAEGWEVFYVVVTGGDKGTHDESMHPEKLAAMREEEQRAACRALGVKECILLGYPDGFTDDDHELRGHIVRLLRLYRPDVVITWDAFERGFNHRDHRNIGTVTADAIYPLVRDRLFYPRDEEDGLASHQVNEVLLAGTDKPDYVVDITPHWEKKVEAILCHASQIGGRTREDFLKQRREQVERDGDKPIEERFRRWSISRPPRQTPPESQPTAAPEAEAPGSAPDGQEAPPRRTRRTARSKAATNSGNRKNEASPA